MDIKEKVSVWAGILTVALFVAEDRVANELAFSPDPWFLTVASTLFGYAIGFVIVYSIIKWLLERYFRGKSSKPPSPPPPFAPP